MLNRFLNVHKLAFFSSRGRPKPAAQPRKEVKEGDQLTSSALKIVHAGGIVDCYYMAVPAVTIMKKHPSFILARPEVFRRPWDSLVRSDEILTPGEKLYLVPRRTVKKLRRRIKRPINGGEVSVNSFISQLSSIDVSSDGFSSKSFLQRNEVSDSSEVSGLFSSSRRKKIGTKKKHVTFADIDVMQKPGLPAIEQRKDEGIAESFKKKSPNLEPEVGKRKSRNGVLWQPRLTAITERHEPGE
ncbi:hypothetical protein PTKIN_Ptkin15bG0152900 [Pterospermum kingtungense]